MVVVWTERKNNLICCAIAQFLAIYALVLTNLFFSIASLRVNTE
ncbi:MAG: hypothetical protein V7K79_18215 [Nostoc sp.]